MKLKQAKDILSNYLLLLLNEQNTINEHSLLIKHPSRTVEQQKIINEGIHKANFLWQVIEFLDKGTVPPLPSE